MKTLALASGHVIYVFLATTIVRPTAGSKIPVDTPGDSFVDLKQTHKSIKFDHDKTNSLNKNRKIFYCNNK